MKAFIISTLALVFSVQTMAIEIEFDGQRPFYIEANSSNIHWGILHNSYIVGVNDIIRVKFVDQELDGQCQLSYYNSQSTFIFEQVIQSNQSCEELNLMFEMTRATADCSLHFAVNPSTNSFERVYSSCDPYR